MQTQRNTKIMKTGGIVTAVFFAVFLLVLGYFSFFGERREISEAENREVAQMPEFTYDTWVSGEFSEEYDNYVADNFPWRDDFLQVNADINSVYTQVSFDDEGVWIENRFLYKDRGMGLYYPTDEDLATYTDAINYVKERLPDTDIYVMLIPGAFNFYAPLKFQDPTTMSDKNIERTFDKISDDVNKVNIYSALEDAKDDYIYFRTDFHWTARGAYCAYKVFADMAGYDPVSLDEMRHAIVDGDFPGELILEMHEPEALKEAPDFVEVFFPELEYTAMMYADTDMVDGTPIEIVRDAVNWWNKYYVFNKGDQPLIHINTENKNGKSLLVIKDSFANAMTAFMVCDYEDVYYMDYRLIKADIFSFVEEHSIDSVLFLNKLTLDRSISMFIHMENEVR
ncbi:MAG: DHHW family protein [Oscillospiraceae bacterium]|nr:DHHW family protein [Oscillospiraceae bacterium]